MKFKMVHENYNVADLNKSMAFYEKALGLHEVDALRATGLSLFILETKKPLLCWNSHG
jgi:lactoylglutathione lyase